MKKYQKTLTNIWTLGKNSLPLHRYPENNLFTLKKD